MSAGYEISGSTSATDTLATSATSGFGGNASYVGASFNQASKWNLPLILAGLAVAAFFFFSSKRRAK